MSRSPVDVKAKFPNLHRPGNFIRLDLTLMTHGDELGIGPSDLLVCIAYLATADYRTFVATTDLKTLASQTRLKPDTITAAKKRLAAAGLLDIDFTSKPHVCDVMPLMTRLNNLAGPARQDPKGGHHKTRKKGTPGVKTFRSTAVENPPGVEGPEQELPSFDPFVLAEVKRRRLQHGNAYAVTDNEMRWIITFASRDYRTKFGFPPSGDQVKSAREKIPETNTTRREKMVYDLHGRRAVVHGRPGGR